MKMIGWWQWMFVVILVSSLAQADDSHYRDILIGERATGLGGAYIALSDDPSGIFHNPAGIIFSFENYFSLSANAYNYNAKTYKSVFPNADYETKSSAVVPNFFGFIQNYKRMKWGFAIVVPNSDSIDQDDYVTGISSVAGETNVFKRKLFHQNTSTYLGPAIAFEAAKNFTIGLTLFGHYHEEKRIDNQLVINNADISDNEKFYIQNTTINRTTFSVVPKLGIQYMPLPKWSIGLVVSQGFTLSSSQKLNVIYADIPEGASPDIGDTDTFNQLNFKTEPDELTPLEVGLGIAYLPSKKFLLTGDLYYHGAAETDLQTAEAIFNFSIGTEYYVNDGFAIRTGVYSNNSNAPLVKAGNVNQPENINYYGLATGLSWINSGSSFSMGFSYALGTGKAQQRGDLTDIQDVEAVSAMVYITGSYQL